MLDCEKVGCGVDCCVRKILSSQPVFKMKEAGYRRWLNHVRGHLQCFLSKFHGELNFIKMIWGYIQPALRKKFKYCFEDRKVHFPLQLEFVPIDFVSKESRQQCFRFLSLEVLF